MRLFIILFLFITSTFATNLPHIYVFHINGISNTQQEAEDNAKALQRTMTIHTNLVADYRVKYIYNPTHGFFFDILDDLQVQKAKENQVISIDDDVQAYMQDNNLSYPVNSPQYNALKNNMTSLYTNELYEAAGVDWDYVLSQFHDQVPSQPPVEFADVANILYNDANAYAIFIPHSQGNLYANILYEYLSSVEQFDANKMMILGIGDPARDIKGANSSYITASNDYVIGASRILYSNVLPNNQHINSSNDILNHSLVDAYLHDSAIH